MVIIEPGAPWPRVALEAVGHVAAIVHLQEAPTEAKLAGVRKAILAIERSGAILQRGVFVIGKAPEHEQLDRRCRLFRAFSALLPTARCHRIVLAAAGAAGVTFADVVALAASLPVRTLRRLRVDVRFVGRAETQFCPAIENDRSDG